MVDGQIVGELNSQDISLPNLGNEPPFPFLIIYFVPNGEVASNFKVTKSPRFLGEKLF